MTYTPDYTMIQEAFTYARILGQSWIIPLLVTIISMVFITRDIEKWKIMAFPMWCGWWIIGIRGTGITNFLIFLILGIMFTIELLSTQLLGNMLQPVREYIKMRTDKEYNKDRETERMTREIKSRKVAMQYLKALKKLNPDGTEKT